MHKLKDLFKPKKIPTRDFNITLEATHSFICKNCRCVYLTEKTATKCCHRGVERVITFKIKQN